MESLECDDGIGVSRSCVGLCKMSHERLGSFTDAGSYRTSRDRRARVFLMLCKGLDTMHSMICRTFRPDRLDTAARFHEPSRAFSSD